LTLRQEGPADKRGSRSSYLRFTHDPIGTPILLFPDRASSINPQLP
jgi:hypothetical protein